MAPKKFFFNFSHCIVCNIISIELVVIAFYFSVKMSSVTESAQIYSLLIQQHYKVSFHIRAVVFMPSCSNRCNYQMEGNNPQLLCQMILKRWGKGMGRWRQIKSQRLIGPSATDHARVLQHRGNITDSTPVEWDALLT